MPKYKTIAATAVSVANKVGNALLNPGWSIASLIRANALDDVASIPVLCVTKGASF